MPTMLPDRVVLKQDPGGVLAIVAVMLAVVVVAVRVSRPSPPREGTVTDGGASPYFMM